jgi:hypothetical protein
LIVWNLHHWVKWLSKFNICKRVEQLKRRLIWNKNLNSCIYGWIFRFLKTPWLNPVLFRNMLPVFHVHVVYCSGFLINLI